MQSLPHKVRGKIDEYEEEEQRLAKQRNCSYGPSWEMTIPIDPPGYRLAVQNLTHFLDLFQCMLCYPSHTAHSLLHMANHPVKACATPTNSNAHTSVQRSMQGIHCMGIRIPSPLVKYTENMIISQWASGSGIKWKSMSTWRVDDNTCCLQTVNVVQCMCDSLSTKHVLSGCHLPCSLLESELPFVLWAEYFT